MSETKPDYCGSCGRMFDESVIVKTSLGPWKDWMCKDCARKHDPNHDEYL